MAFVLGELNSSAPSGDQTGPSVNSKPPATRSISAVARRPGWNSSDAVRIQM